MPEENKSSPFTHINEALGHLAQPGAIHKTGGSMGWVYTWENLKPDVQGDIVQIDKLLTQTDLSKEEVEPIAAEIMFGTAYNDHVSLSFVIRKLQARISMKRKGREDTKALVIGASGKISSPISLGPLRRIFSNQPKEEKKEGQGEEWSQASG